MSIVKFYTPEAEVDKGFAGPKANTPFRGDVPKYDLSDDPALAAKLQAVVDYSIYKHTKDTLANTPLDKQPEWAKDLVAKSVKKPVGYDELTKIDGATNESLLDKIASSVSSKKPELQTLLTDAKKIISLDKASKVLGATRAEMANSVTQAYKKARSLGERIKGFLVNVTKINRSESSPGGPVSTPRAQGQGQGRGRK